MPLLSTRYNIKKRIGSIQVKFIRELTLGLAFLTAGHYPFNVAINMFSPFAITNSAAELDGVRLRLATK